MQVLILLMLWLIVLCLLCDLRREDCIELLGDCSNSTYSIAAICDIIAPASTNDNCISLSEYTSMSFIMHSAVLLNIVSHWHSEPSQKSKYEVSLVTNPCDPNPCKEGFFCSVNNLCRHGDHACSHYFCEPGCSLGDSPSLIYPGGSRIKVPVEMLSSDNGRILCVWHVISLHVLYVGLHLETRTRIYLSPCNALYKMTYSNRYCACDPDLCAEIRTPL